VKTLLGAALVVWLVIGAVAASQRGYFGNDRKVTCRSATNLVLTVVAGPLNYAGIDPKVGCHTPHPSK
jgi:hypothetical protein